MASAPVSDPLLILREYRQLAPWSLRDLAMVRERYFTPAVARALVRVS